MPLHGPRRRRRLPLRTTAVVAALAMAASAAYTVQLGDTLTAIARHVGASVVALVDANDLADPNRIFAGQRLDVPARPGGFPGQRPGADRAQVGALIERTARAHGWNPAFVKALAWQESGWQQDRVSSAGAVGIMQVLPSTGAFVSRRFAGRTLDLHDPADNVLAGVLFLDHLHDLTDGDAELVLAGYYQGLRSMRERGMFPSTRRYIDNVLALKARF